MQHLLRRTTMAAGALTRGAGAQRPFFSFASGGTGGTGGPSAAAAGSAPSAAAGGGTQAPRDWEAEQEETLEEAHASAATEIFRARRRQRLSGNDPGVARARSALATAHADALAAAEARREKRRAIATEAPAAAAAAARFGAVPLSAADVFRQRRQNGEELRVSARTLETPMPEIESRVAPRRDVLRDATTTQDDEAERAEDRQHQDQKQQQQDHQQQQQQQEQRQEQQQQKQQKPRGFPVTETALVALVLGALYAYANRSTRKPATATNTTASTTAASTATTTAATPATNTARPAPGDGDKGASATGGVAHTSSNRPVWLQRGS